MTSQPTSAFCVFVLAVSAASGQGSRPEFEVASIKPAAPPAIMGHNVAIRIGMRMDAGRMEYSNGSLRDLLRTAYRVKDYQIVGPDWLNETRFDVVAKIPEGVSTDLVPEMLQSLLADRFKVSLHHENKEHNVYAMVPGKNGPKLKASDPNDDSPAGSGMGGDKMLAVPAGAVSFGASTSSAHAGGASWSGSAPGGSASGSTAGARPATGGPSGGGASGGGASGGSASSGSATGGGPSGASGGAAPAARSTMSFRMGSGSMKMTAKKMTMSAFADMVARYVDRPVVDMTGIQGIYDFELELSPESMMAMKGVGGGMMAVRVAGPDGGAHAPSEASEATGVTIFQAVQNYGLRLDGRKAPLDTLVVDRAEKLPSEN